MLHMLWQTCRCWSQTWSQVQILSVMLAVQYVWPVPLSQSLCSGVNKVIASSQHTFNDCHCKLSCVLRLQCALPFLPRLCEKLQRQGDRECPYCRAPHDGIIHTIFQLKSTMRGTFFHPNQVLNRCHMQSTACNQMFSGKDSFLKNYLLIHIDWH